MKCPDCGLDLAHIIKEQTILENQEKAERYNELVECYGFEKEWLENKRLRELVEKEIEICKQEVDSGVYSISETSGIENTRDLFQSILEQSKLQAPKI